MIQQHIRGIVENKLFPLCNKFPRKLISFKRRIKTILRILWLFFLRFFCWPLGCNLKTLFGVGRSSFLSCLIKRFSHRFAVRLRLVFCFRERDFRCVQGLLWKWLRKTQGFSDFLQHVSSISKKLPKYGLIRTKFQIRKFLINCQTDESIT